MHAPWTPIARLLLAPVMALSLGGCGTLSDEERVQLGTAIFAAVVAGTAEGVENKRVRDSARSAAALAWSCRSDDVKARIRSEYGNTHLVSVSGCGQTATYQCVPRQCWELATPGAASTPGT